MAGPLHAASCTPLSLDQIPILREQIPLSSQRVVDGAYSFDDVTRRMHVSVIVPQFRFRNGLPTRNALFEEFTTAAKSAITAEFSFWGEDAWLYNSSVALSPPYAALDETLLKHKPRPRQMLRRIVGDRKPHQALFSYFNNIASKALTEAEIPVPTLVDTKYEPDTQAVLLGKGNLEAQLITRYQLNQLLTGQPALSHSYIRDCCYELNIAHAYRRRRIAA